MNVRPQVPSSDEPIAATTRRGWRNATPKRRNVVVWIWGRGYRVSRLRLILAALTPGDLYLHRWGKP